MSADGTTGYGPFKASYPVEEVECHRCQGNGEVDTWDDCFGEGCTRCWDCGGSGVTWVCANCYDDWDGCTVCSPPAPDALVGRSAVLGGSQRDTT